MCVVFGQWPLELQPHAYPQHDGALKKPERSDNFDRSGACMKDKRVCGTIYHAKEDTM